MADNKDNKENKEEDAKWYKVPLRDWVIIGGFIASYVNFASVISSYDAKIDTIVKSVSDMNVIFKEMQQQQKADYKYFSETIGKMTTEMEVLKIRVQSLENKK